MRVCSLNVKVISRAIINTSETVAEGNMIFVIGLQPRRLALEPVCLPSGLWQMLYRPLQQSIRLYCQLLLVVSGHRGSVLKAGWKELPMTAGCRRSPPRICRKSRVVLGITNNFSLLLSPEGLPWQPSRLRDCWLYLTEWYNVLLVTTSCRSPLRACPASWVV